MDFHGGHSMRVKTEMSLYTIRRHHIFYFLIDSPHRRDYSPDAQAATPRSRPAGQELHEFPSSRESSRHPGWHPSNEKIPEGESLQ